MMRARGKRLDRVGGAISAAPVLAHVLDEAYAWFTDFGELPDEDHVADAVMQRALRGGDDDVGAGRSAGRKVAHSAHQPFLTVREPLLDEALDENPWSRRMARAAICVEVAHGGNVESPGFAGHHGLPMFGSVGMHVLGYPRKWIREPYKCQGQRLLIRWDDLRSRIDQRNPKWFEPLGAAILTFHTEGKLTTDELLLELVIADAELDLHRANKRGQDVAGTMSLFNRIARGEGEERQDALRQVCELAAAGKLIPALKDAHRRRTTLLS